MNIIEHGGQCCGIRTIYGFDNSNEETLVTYLRNVDAMTGVSRSQNRLVEVVLSQRQMDGDRAPADGWPAILQRNGFVLVNVFQNANTSRLCYVFHRNGVGQPLPVMHPQWNGGVGSQAVPRAPIQPANEWRVGDRIRYNLEGRFHGQIATITRVREGTDDRRYDITFESGVLRERYTSMYFLRVVEPAHQPVSRVLYTTYHNVLRAGRGAGFPTLEAARAAAPRARSIDRLDVMSDGELRWTADVGR